MTDVMGFTCEDDYLFSIFNAGYMLGMLTGAFVLGILSDKASSLLRRGSACELRNFSNGNKYKLTK